MKTTTKTSKIIIQWIEIMPDGKPVIQSRKYNNEDKALAFAQKLPQRGIKDCTEKITKVLHFEEEIPEGQLRMEV